MTEDYQEIYILSDPRTLTVRYVGISSNALRRYKQHIAVSHSLQLQTWNASLEKFQLTPGVTVIDEAATSEKGLEKEAFWIHWFLRHGAQLFNVERPSLSVSRRIEIFEKLTPNSWRSLDRSMGEIVQAIVSGHYENISYKDLASVEWRLFALCDYEALMSWWSAHRTPREEINKEGLKRFGVPVLEKSGN